MHRCRLRKTKRGPEDPRLCHDYMRFTRRKGTIIAVVLMTIAETKFRLINLTSTSNPTINMYNISPKYANTPNVVIDLSGKMVSVNFGMYPHTDGPNTIPVITSDMTEGSKNLRT